MIIIFLLVFSCTNKKDGYTPPSFPVEKNIEAVLLSDDLLMNYAYGMCVDNKFVYVLALSDGHWIQVYDKHKGDYVGSYIRHGQGPEELVMGISMTIDNSNKTLSVYDERQQKLLVYSIDNTGNAPVFSLVENKHFTQYAGVVRKAWKLKDDNYLIDGQLGGKSRKQKRFQLLVAEEVVDSFNVFPVRGFELETAFISPKVTLSPSREKMASGILFGAILETFSLLDQSIKLTDIQKFYSPNMKMMDGGVRPDPDMTYGFASLCSTEDNIYAIWVGDKNPNTLNSIAIFDWSGKEIARYQTNHLVFMIAINENEPEKLYAMVYDDEKGFSLVYFHI